MTNRIEKCPLMCMKKQPRGSMNYKFDETTKFYAVNGKTTQQLQWSVLLMESNPWQTKLDWTIPQSSKSVFCNCLVKSYNANMGGVDRFDQNVSYYRIGIRSKSGISSWSHSESMRRYKTRGNYTGPSPITKTMLWISEGELSKRTSVFAPSKESGKE